MGLGILFFDFVFFFEDNLCLFNGGCIKVDEKNVCLIVECVLDRLEEIFNLLVVVFGINCFFWVVDIVMLKLEFVDI